MSREVGIAGDDGGRLRSLQHIPRGRGRLGRHLAVHDADGRDLTQRLQAMRQRVERCQSLRGADGVDAHRFQRGECGAGVECVVRTGHCDARSREYVHVTATDEIFRHVPAFSLAEQHALRLMCGLLQQ